MVPLSYFIPILNYSREIRFSQSCCLSLVVQLVVLMALNVISPTVFLSMTGLILIP